jgi:hypothetical protein
MKSNKPLPSSYFLSVRPMYWRDLLFGYDIGYVDKPTLVLEALEKNSKGPHSELQLELAFLLPNELDRAPEIVRELASEEPSESETALKTKWLYLVLQWNFDNRNICDEPLKAVAGVYEEFGYPAEMNDFIYYMPPRDGYDPLAHSLDENRTRLMKLWEQYLVRQRKALGIELDKRN